MIATTKTSFIVPNGVYVAKVNAAKEGVSPGKGTPFIEMELAIVKAAEGAEAHEGKTLKYISMYFTPANGARVEAFLKAFYPEKEYEEGDSLSANAQDLLGERVTIVVGQEEYEKKDGSPGVKNVVTRWATEDAFDTILAQHNHPLDEED